MQNNQLKYYANQTAGTMYGGIGCGFYKVNGVYWMGKKFNGFGIFRFRKSDIAVDANGNATAATAGEDPFKMILPFVQMTQYYVDQANGQIYFYMQNNMNSTGPKVPGVYRLPMSAVEAHDALGEDTPITDAVLIDDSPVRATAMSVWESPSSPVMESMFTGVTSLLPAMTNRCPTAWLLIPAIPCTTAVSSACRLSPTRMAPCR